MTPIWALRSRLEKQPTDLAAARQSTCYFGDRTLGVGEGIAEATKVTGGFGLVAESLRRKNEMPDRPFYLLVQSLHGLKRKPLNGARF
jgi:hypothetical protein